MPLVKRVFRVRCISEPCEKIAERISEHVALVGEYTITIHDNWISIEFHGYESEIKRAWARIKSLLAGLPKAGRGGSSFELNALFRDLGSTFPPRVLVEVLKRRGFTAALDKDSNRVITNAGKEVVYELSKRIIELAKRMPGNVRGLSTKYYLLTIGALTGAPLEEILERALAFSHLRRDEEGSIVLNIEWVQGVDEFLKKVKHSTG